MLKAISNDLPPDTTEYLLLEAHNLLPTEECIQRLKRTEESRCEDCDELDSTRRLITCKAIEPALERLKSEWGLLYLKQTCERSNAMRATILNATDRMNPGKDSAIIKRFA